LSIEGLNKLVMLRPLSQTNKNKRKADVPSKDLGDDEALDEAMDEVTFPDPFEDLGEQLEDCLEELCSCESPTAELKHGYKCTAAQASHWLYKKYMTVSYGKDLYDMLNPSTVIILPPPPPSPLRM
jgi:hypothetical protein